MKPFLLVIVALCLSVVEVQAQAPTTKINRPELPEGLQVLREIPYVKEGHVRHKLDLYLPENGENLPLLIWIHGGGWEGGNKDNPRPLAGLHRSGYALASINYRLSQHAPFPAQLEDCKAAIRWLRANAKKHRIDENRFGVWGQSAGGHLAALVGATSLTDEFDHGDNEKISSGVQAICDYCGPTNLALYQRSRADDTLGRLIGGPIQDHPDKVSRANPLTYLKAGLPPFFIVHGDKDQIVPLEHSQILAEGLRKAKVPVKFYVAEGKGHALGDPQATEASWKFFDEHLKQKR